MKLEMDEDWSGLTHRDAPSVVARVRNAWLGDAGQSARLGRRNRLNPARFGNSSKDVVPGRLTGVGHLFGRV